jgi:PRP1 splicing factor, N-terminal
MATRRDFLNQQAPENYVAGLGRGATGFTTRSDLGPAREGPTPEQIQEALAKRAQQLGAAPPTAYGAPDKKKEEEHDDDDERFQDPENEVGLFAYGTYDRDDDEADRLYQDVDEKMDRRRKMRRLVFPVPFPTLQTPLGKPTVYLSPPLKNRLPTRTYSIPIGKHERNKNERSTSATIQKYNNSLPT